MRRTPARTRSLCQVSLEIFKFDLSRQFCGHCTVLVQLKAISRADNLCAMAVSVDTNRTFRVKRFVKYVKMCKKSCKMCQINKLGGDTEISSVEI